jgi:hypothetical protein
LVQCARVYMQRLEHQKGLWLTGCAHCSADDTRMWWPVPWPTNWRVSLGR